MFDVALNRDCTSIIDGKYNLDEIKEFEGGSIQILLYKNEEEIGFIDGSMDCDSFHIELIELYDEYIGKGLGHESIETLKNICRDLNMKCIHGESRNKYKKFYRDLGAIYENREEIDTTFLLDKFYIDL